MRPSHSPATAWLISVFPWLTCGANRTDALIVHLCVSVRSRNPNKAVSGLIRVVQGGMMPVRRPRGDAVGYAATHRKNNGHGQGPRGGLPLRAGPLPRMPEDCADRCRGGRD